MTDSIVVQALKAELKRATGRLEGAEKRLVFAQSQVATETTLTAEYERDIKMLRSAIFANDGNPDDEDLLPGEERYTDDEVIKAS